MADWQIARPTGRCATCGRQLAEGEPFHAVLMESGGTFERLDYDQEHWAGVPADALGYWRSRVPVRDQKHKVALDKETLCELFRRLGPAGTPARKQFRFVLALWLMRKKLLRFEQTLREGGAEVWQMRMPADDSEHRVERVLLTDAELTSANEQLQALLEGGTVSFEPAEEQPSTAEADEGGS